MLQRLFIRFNLLIANEMNNAVIMNNTKGMRNRSDPSALIIVKLKNPCKSVARVRPEKSVKPRFFFENSLKARKYPKSPEARA